MRAMSGTAWFFLLGVFAFSVGCEQRSWKDWNHPRVGWDEDEQIRRMEKYHREFGEIALSRPVVVSKPDKIKLDFQLSAKDIYSDIGIQVGSRIGQFEAASFRGAGKFEAPIIPEHTETPIGPAVGLGGLQAIVEAATKDPKPENLEVLASVLKAAIEAAKPLAEPVTVPARNPLSAPDLPENLAEKRVKEFADAAKIFDPLPGLRLNAVNRFTETANAYYHMRLHELFSDIDQIKAADSEEPVLLAGFITICPGSITSSGYIAETVFAPYLEFGTHTVAMPVVSLFPSAIGQNLDLQSMFTLQRSLALKMQAAGYAFGGAGQYDWSKLDELNTRSLNQRVTVSAFNRGQAMQVGWRIRGEYWAAGSGAKWRGRLVNSGDAVLMQDISLPVMLVAIAPKMVKGVLQATQDHNKLLVELEELLKPAPNVDKDKLGAWLERIRNLIRRIKVLDNPSALESSQLITLLNDWIGKNETLAKKVEERLARPGVVWDIHEFGSPMSEAREAMEMWVKDWRPSLRCDIHTAWIPEREDDYKKYPELATIEGKYRAQVVDGLGRSGPTRAKTGTLGTYEHTWNCVAHDAIRDGVSPTVVIKFPFPIDAPKQKPTISDVYPTRLPTDRAAALVVTGESFQKDMQVVVGPHSARVLAAATNVAVVLVDPVAVSTRLPVGGKVRVVTGAGASELSATTVEFTESPERSDRPRTLFEFKSNGQTTHSLDVTELSGGARPEVLKAFDPCREKPCREDKKP